MKVAVVPFGLLLEAFRALSTSVLELDLDR